MRKTVIFCLLIYVFSLNAFSQPVTLPIPGINIGVTPAEEVEEVSLTIQIMILLTILALAPSLIMMLTSFVRVFVVLLFVQRAMGTQNMPPNQVIVGLALFITFFVMAPTIKNVNDSAIQPFLNTEITKEEAFENTMTHLRTFMFRQTREQDLALFIRLGNIERPRNMSEVPSYILIPSFMLSELRTAFTMGILIFLPFIVIDMVVASILMSMGMIMLPPVMISLPFKIILFVLVDGWGLITNQLIVSFG